MKKEVILIALLSVAIGCLGAETNNDEATTSSKKKIEQGKSYNKEEYLALTESFAKEKGWTFKKEAAEKNFEKSDTNKDNVVSTEELLVAKKKRKASKEASTKQS